MTSSPLIKNAELILDDKPSIYALRQKSQTTLNNIGFPTHKTEAWKYTDTTPIINSDFNLPINSSEECHCCQNKEDDSPYIIINFCNGRLHIKEWNTPEGLSITHLPLYLFDNEYKNYLLKSYDIEKHPFATLNSMYLEEGVCIHLEENVKLTKPINIIYNQSHNNNEQLNIHNIVILEKNAKLELIEQFKSFNDNIYFSNIVNEIYVKNGADLNHYKIQKESFKSYHIALNAVKINEDAQYKQYYVANGGKICRNETQIDLLKRNANAEVYSSYIAKKDCVNDITTNINHIHEQTTSNQFAKAVLETNSTATFQGKIHLYPNAIKTTGYQLHKALYLEKNATLNCKPELEIYADDVKCSHGATCGELDKEQLFYLLSRGISKETAVKMLIQAHLEETINLIPNSQIKELFLNSIN